MRCEIIPRKEWVNQVTGQKASVYGAVPYTSDRERDQWKVVETGYTVRNLNTGTVGAYAIRPNMTRDQVKALVDGWGWTEVKI